MKSAKTKTNGSKKSLKSKAKQVIKKSVVKARASTKRVVKKAVAAARPAQHTLLEDVRDKAIRVVRNAERAVAKVARDMTHAITK